MLLRTHKDSLDRHRSPVFPTQNIGKTAFIEGGLSNFQREVDANIAFASKLYGLTSDPWFSTDRVNNGDALKQWCSWIRDTFLVLAHKLQEPSKTGHFGHLASERQSATSKAERDVHGDLRNDPCTPQAAADQI